MELNDEYYSKIVYKKNAFNDLMVDLKVYYFGKRVLFLSTKGVSSKHITEVVNSLSLARCEFVQFISKHHFDNAELKTISDLCLQNMFDLIVVLGSGKSVDVAKYFANVFNVPYFVCPTAPTNISYFSKLCVNPYDSTRSFYADEPERIYISEMVIKKTPKHLIKQGICFILSFYEYIVSVGIDNILFDKNVDTTGVKKVISKTENELDDLLTGDDDAKLSLMDFLIDLGYHFRDADFFAMSNYNLFFVLNKISAEQEKNIGCGEMMLVCSKMLIESYKKLFAQKTVKRLIFPDYEKIAKKVKKFNIFAKKINNFLFFDEICENKKLLERINNLKEEFCFQCTKRGAELALSLDKVAKYNKFTYGDKLDIDNCFEAMSVVPFVTKNNFLVSLIGGIGMLNVL